MQYKLFLILCFTVSTLFGQQHYFKQWNADNGLAVTDVNDIAQDQLGNLWLATEGGGLVRFDGKELFPFTMEDGLPSDFVTNLMFQDHLLWIGTEKGLCVYNGTEIVTLDSLEGYVSNRIKQVLSFDNNLYVQTRYGVYEYDGERFYSLLADFFEAQEVYYAHLKENLLYVYCDSGTVEYDLNSGNWSNSTDEESIQFAFDSENYSLRASSKKTQLLYKGTVIPIELENVRSANEDGNILIIGHVDGLTILEKGEIRHLNNNNGLHATRVKSCFKDDFGSLWIGASNGLFKYVNPAIQTFGASEGLRNAQVSAIYRNENVVWFGTQKGVLKFEDEQMEEVPGLGGGMVFKIIQDSRKQKWIATEKGLFLESNGRVTNIQQQFSLPESFVFDVLESKTGEVVFATSNSLYQIKKGNLFDLFETSEGFNGVSRVLEDELGKLWMYHIDGRLGIWDHGKYESIEFFGDFELRSVRLNAFLPLGEGQVLLASAENGLYVWNGSSIKQINESNGLHSNKVKGLERIEGDQVVVLLEEGMQILKMNNDAFQVGRYIGENDGFITNESLANALYLYKGNELWVGTKTGALKVNLRNQMNSEVKYEPKISKIDLFFNPETSWSDVDQSVPSWGVIPNSLNLPYDQNYLTIHFTAHASIDPYQLYYRYKLDGQDEQWTYPIENLEAVFTNIHSGKYHFILEASPYKDFRESKQLSYEINMIPPIWKTRWFWIVIVVVVGAIVAWLVRFRINQLNTKLNLETALAESERKALRLQMNPHFIFNALDSISGFIFKNEPKQAVQYLNSFAKLMRLTLETSREKLIVLETEINLIRNYLQIEQLRFSHSFDFTIEVDDEIDPYDTKLPPMLIQPNLENALLHGLRPKGEGGMLWVRFQKETNHLLCIIEDNGIGREKAKDLQKNTGKHRGLATNITNERMEVLSKSLGLRFYYAIDDLTDDAGEASGTRVTLKMPLIIDDGFE